jgi:hypothetical protein
MGWILAIGCAHVERKGDLVPVPPEILRNEGVATSYTFGPYKGYFKAKQALEGRFKGRINVDYHSQTEGTLKEWPYVRFFEIFEYSDPEFDAQVEEWEFKRDNPGVW